MASINPRSIEAPTEVKVAVADALPVDAKDHSSAGTRIRPLPRTNPPRPNHPRPSPDTAGESGCCWLLLAAAVAGLAAAGYFLVPWAKTALNTVSTDDAYVNGHVTFVASRSAIPSLLSQRRAVGLRSAAASACCRRVSSDRAADCPKSCRLITSSCSTKGRASSSRP